MLTYSQQLLKTVLMTGLVMTETTLFFRIGAPEIWLGAEQTHQGDCLVAALRQLRNWITTNSIKSWCVVVAIIWVYFYVLVWNKATPINWPPAGYFVVAIAGPNVRLPQEANKKAVRDVTLRFSTRAARLAAS